MKQEVVSTYDITVTGIITTSRDIFRVQHIYNKPGSHPDDHKPGVRKSKITSEYCSSHVSARFNRKDMKSLIESTSSSTSTETSAFIRNKDYRTKDKFTFLAFMSLLFKLKIKFII